MRRSVASGAAIAIAAAVLTACGGGGSSKGNPLTPGTSGGNGSPSSSELSHLVTNAPKQKFKVTYTDSSGDTQTYAQDGNGDTMQGDRDSETFTTKTDTISCDKSSGAFQCTQTPGSIGAAANPFLSVLALEESYFSELGNSFGTTSTKTISGRAAQCVTISAKDLAGAVGGATVKAGGASLKGSATYCIDKDTGATLEVAGIDDSGKASTSLLVTKFQAPSPSDFVPPATPSTIPSSITIPGGGIITSPNATIPGGN